MNHAIVSRHLVGLEQRYGLSLFDRRTGKLTKAGVEFHGRIGRALMEIVGADEALRAADRSRLTIFCASGLALHWLTGRLSSFQSRLDETVIDLQSSDHEPDLLEGVAAGDIRYVIDGDNPKQAGLDVLQLGRPKVFPVLAPALAQELAGTVGNATDLLKLPLIEEQGGEGWRLWFAAQGLSDAAPQPVARYGSALLSLAAARAGQGIALGNQFLVADDLREGRLVQAVPSTTPFAPVEFGAYVFRASHVRWNEPILARFRKWLASEFSRDG